MVNIAINGAAGRMGRRLMALAVEDGDLRLTCAADDPACGFIGEDAGSLAGIKPLNLKLTGEINPAGKPVVIDFSSPAGTRKMIDLCAKHGLPLLVGTTGLTREDHQVITRAGNSIAVLQSPNMSLGVNLLFALAAQAARRLGAAYDIEIVESHHRFKKDAPSGTALGILEAICQATDRDPQRDVVHGRHGADVPRKPGQIGMHALRMGDVVGDHSVYFAAMGERLELRHTATTRDVFVRGALHAAKWLATRAGQPGRYHMADVLGA